ncbi:tape measure protein [Marinobacter sp.]|uniref:tape measure protein n=1 Tax=Pseudomonadales TaxID=72274 RepID=UPI003A91D3EE
MIVSKYTISVGINFPKSEIRKIDFQLKALEKRFQAFGKNMATSFAKTLTLPELKVKKLTLDSLGAQRTLQTDLNRIGRLLQVPIGNVQLDQARINKQLQGVMTRAASAARINIRTIQGSHGGSNIHYPSHLGVPRGFDAFSGGFGGAGAAGFLPRVGPVGMGAAGVAAAGMYAGTKVNQARELMSSREMQRLQLEIAVGGSEERRQSSIDALIGLANKLGTVAETQVDGYSKFMKQAQLSMKLTAQQGFNLYQNMGIATKGNGGDDMSIQRQAYALQQIGGLGYLRAEELNQQLADSNPAIRSYIIKAWEERTGQSGVDKFLKAMSKREVSFNDVMRGYELAAKDAAGKVEELSNTIQGESARLQNAKFAEELERTKGAMGEASRQFVQSQQELHEAMEPLRDSFYSVAAASTSLAARLISWGVKQSQSAPAVNGEASNEQRSENPWSSSTGRGMFSVPDARAIKQPSYPQFVSPLIPEQKEWEKSRFIPSVDSLMSSTSSKVVNSNPVINQTFNVNGVDSFEFKSLFQNEFRNVIETTMLQYSEKE